MSLVQQIVSLRFLAKAVLVRRMKATANQVGASLVGAPTVAVPAMPRPPRQLIRLMLQFGPELTT